MGGAYIGLNQNGELLISDRSGDYTIAHAETTYTKNEVDVLMDEMSLQVDDVQTGYVNADEAIKASIPSLAFRELAVTMGAVWNASTGFFELNGLTDITEAQMRSIIRYTGNYRPQTDMNSLLRTGTFRTNLCNSNGMVYTGSAGNTVSAYSMCDNRSALEVLQLYNGNLESYMLRVSNAQYMFNNCSSLKIINGRISLNPITSTTMVDHMFYNCTALESVSIYSLGVSLSLSGSPNLTAASVATMVRQAQTGKELTVTLHDTAYTRAVADADVKAASQARPLVTILNATGDKKMGDGETYHKETIGGVETWVKDPVGSEGSEDSGTIN